MSADPADRLARAALLRVLEPGWAPLHALVARCGAVEVWERLRGRGPVGDLPPARVEGARLRAEGCDPVRDLAALARLGGRLVVPGDDEWPVEALDWPPGALEDAPPLGLHVRGEADLAGTTARSVAVVGARAASAYGVVVARELSFGLSERGWAVVSGAAVGIDAAAHEGALSAGAAPTVAVLACGLDRAYPAGHAGLLARTVRGGGLVVSEVPVGSAPTRNRFLVRNRVIAALSQGTVAVEAAARSGSLATLARARALGRHAMAVPGPVTSAASAGSNQALVDGAQCVTGARDVLAVVAPLDAAQELRAGEVRARDALSASARAVLDAVPVRRPAGVAGIARAAGVPALLVQQVLPPLVLHGLVEQLPDGFRLTPLGAGRPASGGVRVSAGP